MSQNILDLLTFERECDTVKSKITTTEHLYRALEDASETLCSVLYHIEQKTTLYLFDLLGLDF